MKPMPSPQEIRGCADTFIAKKCRCVRATYRWRLARFAQYMSLRRTRWPEALQSLIALPEREGTDRLRGFKPWLRSRGYPRNAANGCRSGIQPLVQALKARGLVDWQFRTHSQEKMLADWAGCAPGYRRDLKPWLSLLRENKLQEDTVSQYRGALLQLGLFLRRKRLSIRRMSHAHVVDWLRELHGRNLSQGSINIRLRTAQNFCEWLTHARGLVRNPFEKIGFIKVPNKLPAVLDRREVVRLIEATRTPRDRAILELLYATGCRSSEIKALDLGDLCLGRRLVTCEGPFAARRSLPINFAAAKALRRYLLTRREAKTDALFLNMFGDRLGLPGICTLLANAARRAGIQKPVTPDIIRNSFAAHFLDRKGKEVTLKYILGHKTFAATSRFSSVASENVQRIYDRLHPRA